MRYPKHIILDVSKPVATNMDIYWPYRYRASLSRDAYFNSSLNVRGSFPISLKSRLHGKNSTSFFSVSNTKIDSTSKLKNQVKASALRLRLFDINFLKREKLYTKLKYSRSPAYDIVSGGVAALFSGFIGFLISEKFGIELVDSGDFYTFFMYIVFLCFSLRPFFKIMSEKSTVWSFLSPNFLLDYFTTILTLILRSSKNILLSILKGAEVYTYLTRENLLAVLGLVLLVSLYLTLL
jgi:hypothetical protein